MAICEIEQPDDFSPSQAWSQIGHAPYSKSNTKASRLIDPQHRLPHWMLVHTLKQRKAITKKVPESDMCLLSQQFDCSRFTNLPFVIVTLFMETVKTRDRTRSGLCGGQYITRLANNLKLMTPENRNSLTFVGYLDYIDRGLLVGMRLLVRGEEKTSTCGIKHPYGVNTPKLL